jgi:aspartyl-tRNA(Asn)/glutamyl-tRNA(Gln) amidotransferase subunit A
MSELPTLTLAAAAEGVQQRRFSSWELTSACAKRIAEWQPAVNCFIAVDAGSALKAALVADTKLARGEALGPLHGVPLAHKDIFARAGTVMTAGSIILGELGDSTAAVLERLDAAGAIDLGALNLSEFAAGATGHNRHYGTAHNPWDKSRVPGGSSSGSAIAVAARLVFGSLGTDTGGSIRLPAHFCGVVGLRPTTGRVSRRGVFPRAWSADSVGPLARTCEDAALLLQTIAGADASDDSAEAGIPVPSYRAALAQPLAGLRIGIPNNFFFDGIDGGIARLIEEAKAVLQKLGCAIVPLDVPDPARLIDFANIIARAEAAAIHEEWLRQRPADYDHGVREPTETGLFIPAVHYIKAQRQRGPALKAYLDEVFGKADVLLTPVFEQPTPKLDDTAPVSEEAIARIWSIFGRLTRPFNYLGLPALTVPCGFQPDGMPAGMQLVGPPFAEARLLNLGHLYQRETGWHERVPALPA